MVYLGFCLSHLILLLKQRAVHCRPMNATWVVAESLAFSGNAMCRSLQRVNQRFIVGFILNTELTNFSRMLDVCIFASPNPAQIFGWKSNNKPSWCRVCIVGRGKNCVGVHSFREIRFPGFWITFTPHLLFLKRPQTPSSRPYLAYVSTNHMNVECGDYQ